MGDYRWWVEHILGATLLTKGVYFILVCLSVTVWAIIIRKLRLLRRCRKGGGAFQELYRKGRRNPMALYRHLLTDKDRFASPLTTVFLAGCEELQNQLDRRTTATGEQLPDTPRISTHQLDQISKSLDAVQDRYFLGLEDLLIHLATTISVAPFLGLLGTVWGILIAFQEMDMQGSTGMVAFGPGLSEALVSTVFGLVVAIPALLGYNYIGAKIRELSSETAYFTTDFLALTEKEFVQE